MTNAIRFATVDLWGEIAALWQLCFSEKQEAIDCFFKIHFSPQSTLVCIEDGVVAAMVHMLPGYVVSGRDKLKGHYIYAAATHPKFRSRGLMGRLLEEAARVGAARNESFSYLLPSSESLYQYYGRHGYRSYFKTRFVALTRAELREHATYYPALWTELSLQEMEELRNAHLQALQGSVLWGGQALGYAVALTDIYGGLSVTIKSSSGAGYALCAIAGDNCEVIELVCDTTAWPSLASALLQRVKAFSFRLRLPVESGLLPGCGEVAQFGMIRPLLTTALSADFLAAPSPLLGLTLD